MITISKDKLREIDNRVAVEWFFSGIETSEDVALVNKVLNDSENRDT